MSKPILDIVLVQEFPNRCLKMTFKQNKIRKKQAPCACLQNKILDRQTNFPYI